MNVNPTLELAAHLARHISPKTMNVYGVCRLADRLHRIAVRHTRAACWYCNGKTAAGKPYAMDDYDKDRGGHLTEAAVALVHTGLRAVFTGDPRGCTMHLFSTTKKKFPGNGWGGDDAGFGVS